MPTIQGIVNPAGAKVRQQGAFNVVSKSATHLVVPTGLRAWQVLKENV